MNGVKIKPLAWHNFDAWTWWAEAVCGTYCIDERNGAWNVVLRFHDAAHPITEVSDFDAAKAAAQADYERRILAALDTLAPDAVEALVKAAIPTRDRLPEKPGLKSYEQIPCLIFVDSDWEISVWNCEHLCWDDSSGDDFRYHPYRPDLWLPLPYGEPLVAALAAIRGGAK